MVGWPGDGVVGGGVVGGVDGGGDRGVEVVSCDIGVPHGRHVLHARRLAAQPGDHLAVEAERDVDPVALVVVLVVARPAEHGRVEGLGRVDVGAHEIDPARAAGGV